jgi:hypothetical protein
MSTLEDQLAALEAEAERSPPGAAAHVMNRAGDVCLAAGLRERALAFYGRGIDANLRGRRYDAAIGLCHKLLRVEPNAIRTRCTLAWLAIGRGDRAESVREIGDYVAAAIGSGDGARAAKHLALMAEATDDAVVHELIVAQLQRLGSPDAAEHVLRANADRPPTRASAIDAERDVRWAKVVSGALTGPHEL